MLYSILRLKNDTASTDLVPKHWTYQLLVSPHETTGSLLTIQPHGTKVKSRPVPSGGIRTLIDQDGTCKISRRGDTGCFGEKKTRKTSNAHHYQSGLETSEAPSRLSLEQHAGAGRVSCFTLNFHPRLSTNNSPGAEAHDLMPQEHPDRV